MRSLNYIICGFFVFVMTSCDKDYFPDGGIHSDIVNRTENSFTEKKTLYIGAVVGNTFFVTDSTASDVIIDKRSSSTDASLTSIVYGWKPDLKKVKKKSSNGLFLFKLSAGNHIFLHPFNFPQPSLDEGNVDVFIEESGLVNYEDPNKKIKQDYKIVK